jgi:hypothetical protein
MPAPPTTDVSSPASPIEAAKAIRLQELAQSIQARTKRMAQDIYAQGQDLLEAKELFGRGQNQAFLEWARQSAQVQDTLIYRFMQVAQAFPEFSDQDFEVVATALYAIASPSTPSAARAEFLQRSRLGEVISLPDAQAIVQRYSSPQDDQFERYRKLVQPWGDLRRSSDAVAANNREHPPEGKLHLHTLEGDTQTFRHYTDLKQAFLTWRKTTFTADLQAVQTLVAPHWTVRPAPVPSQPFRLEMECQIPGISKALVIKNPRLLMEWWHYQGQELSDRLAANAADAEPKQLLDTLQPSQFAVPTCLNCSWREDTVSVGPDEFWCGFYRTALGLDQAEVRPQICRKWQPLGRLEPVMAETSASELVYRSPPSPSPQLASPQLVTSRSISTRFSSPPEPSPVSPALSALLQQIATLTAAELDQVQQAIDQRRNACRNAVCAPSGSLAAPV